ncbi:MAG: hypothetical protein RLZZ283_265 [Candidatus Parcubacteria bacterium]|jgi:hypothetical protein
MIVHFAASTANIKKQLPLFSDICSYIKQEGHTLSRDWIPHVAKKFGTAGAVEYSSDIYEKVVESILAADILIVEGTHLSFSVGQQITLALSKSKPVLLLRSADTSDGAQPFSFDFLKGIANPLLTIALYRKKDLATIIRTYLVDDSKKGSIKFNIILTRALDAYLEWAAHAYKKNKSQMIRQILTEHMTRRDKKYSALLAAQHH